jgi:hypothetical protein
VWARGRRARRGGTSVAAPAHASSACALLFCAVLLPGGEIYEFSFNLSHPGKSEIVKKSIVSGLPMGQRDISG